MKRIRKIFVILSLSFLMASALIPQKEKEVHAFGITASIILGALAVAGAGGFIAYNNREHIQKVGDDIASKMDEVELASMLSRNKYGISNTLVNKMSESIAQETSTMHNVMQKWNISLAPSATVRLYFKQDIIDSYVVNKKRLIFVVKAGQNSAALRVRNPLGSSNSFRNFPELGSDFYSVFNSYNTVALFQDFNSFVLENISAEPINLNLLLGMSDDSTQARDEQLRYINYAQPGDTVVTPDYYTGALNTAYNNENYEIDYERLENIMTGASNEVITMDNIGTLVSSMGQVIEDAGADTVSALTTIWNGIKNIPTLIQSSSAAILGGISSLTDDLLTGLGNFTGNITAANEQLWTDAGAVWSGLVENINTANDVRSDYTDGLLDSMRGGIDNIRTGAAQNTSEILNRLSIGIDNIREFTGTNATAIGNNIATGIDNIKTFTSTNTARIGGNIQTAATSITDKVTSAATSITDTITGIAVPSTSAIDDYKQRITDMNNKLKKKFEFIMLPIESLKNLYSKPKSLFDVEMVLMDTKVRILPDSFRGTVAYIKPLLNGVIVLLTFMSIYKKIQGEEVV